MHLDDYVLRSQVEAEFEEKIRRLEAELSAANARVAELERYRVSLTTQAAVEHFDREMRRRGVQVVTRFQTPEDDDRTRDNVRIVDKHGQAHWSTSIWKAFEEAEGRYV